MSSSFSTDSSVNIVYVESSELTRIAGVAQTTRPTLGRTGQATSGSINVFWTSLLVSEVQMI